VPLEVSVSAAKLDRLSPEKRRVVEQTKSIFEKCELFLIPFSFLYRFFIMSPLSVFDTSAFDIITAMAARASPLCLIYLSLVSRKQSNILLKNSR
jgi:hypothetical protein